MIMIFVLSACNNAANDEDEMLIAVPDPPTEEAATQPELNDPPADENDDPPEDPPITPEATKWGPLAAEFLDLLATRNYYLKYDVTGASMGPEGDVTIAPDPFLSECARQDDVYAYVYSYPEFEKIFIHEVRKDNKIYSIDHEKGVILVDEPKGTDASDDKDDFFPVSCMEFIESGAGSVDGVSIFYEDYAITGSKTIIRIYIDGAEVAYSVEFYEGNMGMIKTNIKISPDIPSHMLEFPPDFLIVQEELSEMPSR